MVLHSDAIYAIVQNTENPENFNEYDYTSKNINWFKSRRLSQEKTDFQLNHIFFDNFNSGD